MKVYETTKQPEFRPVTIELEPHEAAALRVVFATISGGGPIRKVTNTLCDALYDLGYQSKNSSQAFSAEAELTGKVPEWCAELFGVLDD